MLFFQDDRDTSFTFFKQMYMYVARRSLTRLEFKEGPSSWYRVMDDGKGPDGKGRVGSKRAVMTTLAGGKEGYPKERQRAW